MAIEKLSIMRAITAAGMDGSGAAAAERILARSNPTEIGKLNSSNALGAHKSAAQRSKEIEKASTDFEALLLQQMFKTMWSSMTDEEQGVMGSGKQNEFYRDLMTEQVSQTIAEQQSLGIKELLAADMRKREPTNSGNE